jgi:hypothetical protein
MNFMEGILKHPRLKLIALSATFGLMKIAFLKQ